MAVFLLQRETLFFDGVTLTLTALVRALCDSCWFAAIRLPNRVMHNGGF
jgi:hypothetical protein